MIHPASGFPLHRSDVLVAKLIGIVIVLVVVLAFVGGLRWGSGCRVDVVVGYGHGVSRRFRLSLRAL